MINDSKNFENNLLSTIKINSAAQMCRFFIDLPRTVRELKKTLRKKNSNHCDNKWARLSLEKQTIL